MNNIETAYKCRMIKEWCSEMSKKGKKRKKRKEVRFMYVSVFFLRRQRIHFFIFFFFLDFFSFFLFGLSIYYTTSPFSISPQPISHKKQGKLVSSIL